MAVLLVRFGLPLVVGIHYLTAARGYAFTPDSAFGAAAAAILIPSGGGGATAAGFSPLWSMLLQAGIALGLDPLFTAKILSLVFSSLGVIAVYLLAVEMFEDRILAFLAALAAGLEPWLVAAGGGGTPVSLLFALTYLAFFFLRRKEFAIGGIVIGVAGLVSWPALGLLVVLAVEVFSPGGTNHPRQTLAASLLLAIATVAAGVLFAAAHSLPWFSGSEVPGDVVPASWLQGIPFVLAAGLLVRGWIAVRRFPFLRLVFPGSRASLIPFFVWGGLCAVTFSSSYLLLLGPACVILSLDGIRKSAPSLYREPVSYAPALLVAAFLVLLHQGVFFASVRPAMASAAERGAGEESIAAWLRTNVPQGTRVGAEPAGRLAYLLRADFPVERFSTEIPARFVVRDAPPSGGYIEAYRPSAGDGVAVFKLTIEEKDR